MRLYLSSESFGNHLERLQKMVGENKKVLFIDNAKDDLSEDERFAHVEEKRGEFERAGFKFYELDLRLYANPEKYPVLTELIRSAGLVWAAGGNTFILRRAMHMSWCDSILSSALRDNACVYGGSSAGAIVMTKTLQGVENADNPYSVPDGYDEKIIWDGLGLVYPQLVPHYQSDWFKNEAKAMVDYYTTNGLKHETLRDGEVYMVDGDIEEKLT